ncbi:MAG: flavin reductase family protein [Actinobacteria bacterium]|nr:flavin reductase family protein [Actinomycetota bacterium]
MSDSGGVDAAHFRRVFGHLPTGVTVVTAFGVEEPVGMAANSVTSVSLEPPLLLLCPARASTTWPSLRERGRFCVNVLAHDHEGLSRRFAASGIDRFAGVPWHRRQAGPALDGAVAWIDCEIDAEHAAGDHTVVIARVLDLGVSGAYRPLVFFGGRYGTFAPAEGDGAA